MWGALQSAWTELEPVLGCWRGQGHGGHTLRAPFPRVASTGSGPATSSSLRGQVAVLLEPGKGGRKEGPAHQVFVSGLPEECPSCLLASHACREATGRCTHIQSSVDTDLLPDIHTLTQGPEQDNLPTDTHTHTLTPGPVNTDPEQTMHMHAVPCTQNCSAHSHTNRCTGGPTNRYVLCAHLCEACTNAHTCAVLCVPPSPHTHTCSQELWGEAPLFGLGCVSVQGQVEWWVGAEVRGLLPMYSPCRPRSGTASIFAGPGAVNRNRHAERCSLVLLFPH